MSTQTHTCEKPGCFYCYEMNRNQPVIPPQKIAKMIEAAIMQLSHIAPYETVGVRYSAETDKYIMENIHVPANILAKNIGRSAHAVRVRKCYLRRSA